MTEILNNILVFEVQIGLESFPLHDLLLWGKDVPFPDIKSAEILGCVTENEIDFDCEQFFEVIPINMYEDYRYGIHNEKEKCFDLYTNESKSSFRSLLKSKGIEIKQGMKLLVIRRKIDMKATEQKKLFEDMGGTINARKNPMVRLFGEKEGEKCKDCKFLQRKQLAGVYYKCKFRGNTNGPGTDHKVNWAACSKFEVDIDDISVIKRRLNQKKFIPFAKTISSEHHFLTVEH